MKERTLSIIKPDATKRDLTGRINSMIESAGLRIVGQKRLLLSAQQISQFYKVHSERSFFTSLVNFMSSGPIVVQVLEGEEGSVDAYRTLMGATNPENANDNTIRKLYGESIEANSVHGSDSLENARTEISFFFAEYEICS